MTIIQLLVLADMNLRSYISLYNYFHWFDHKKYSWQEWNTIHEYLRNKAQEELQNDKESLQMQVLRRR